MKPEEIIEIITELNNELYEDNPNLYENGLQYEYSTNGYVDFVAFCGYGIYDSENCLEEDVKESGGFKQYLIKERIKFINMLTKIRVS